MWSRVESRSAQTESLMSKQTEANWGVRVSIAVTDGSTQYGSLRSVITESNCLDFVDVCTEQYLSGCPKQIDLWSPPTPLRVH